MYNPQMATSQIGQPVTCGPMTGSQIGTLMYNDMNPMPSQTLVHQQFVNEPIGTKPVTAIPQIGSQTAQYFYNHNIFEASQVLGKFLILRRDAGNFMAWISGFGCHLGQQRAIYAAINEYELQMELMQCNENNSNGFQTICEKK